MSRAAVRVPGTCGELIQGWLDGRPLLVSCPIDRFAVAEVALCPGGAIEAPADRPRAATALRAALAAFAPAGTGARLTIVSDLPPAKGFGSSTADLVATIAAVARAVGRPADPLTVARLAARIEPTDSTAFPGLAAFDHRAGANHEVYGDPPPLHLAVLDLGGTVDTAAYNRANGRPPAGWDAAAFRAARDLLRDGVRAGRADWIGRAATSSARLHQAILPKPELPALIDLVEREHGLGVVVAHSGTLVGLLTERGADHAGELAERAATTIGRSGGGFVARLIGGGPRPAAGSPVAATGSAAP